MRTVVMIVFCVAFMACGPSHEEPTACLDAGRFRYAFSITPDSYKVLTTTGEYIVAGPVNGTWGSPVTSCYKEPRRGYGDQNYIVIDHVKYFHRQR